MPALQMLLAGGMRRQGGDGACGGAGDQHRIKGCSRPQVGALGPRHACPSRWALFIFRLSRGYSMRVESQVSRSVSVAANLVCYRRVPVPRLHGELCLSVSCCMYVSVSFSVSLCESQRVRELERESTPLPLVDLQLHRGPRD